MNKTNLINHQQKYISKSASDRRLLVKLICDCASEVKLILTGLILLCFLATLIQFIPARLVTFKPQFNHPPFVANPNVNFATTTVPEESLGNRVVKRSFNPVGIAAYNFILMSAYRNGPDVFTVIGLSSKPLHVFGDPGYICEYQSNNTTGFASVSSVKGYKILPDFGYGHVYTTVIITCRFLTNKTAVEDSDAGGRLLLHAPVNGIFDTEVNRTDTILALTEPPRSWNISQLTISLPKYDYIYCGSPLYGDLSPQRVREWIAYHVKLFGERSHFVLYDAGGIHPEVLEVLKPWMERGYVTLEDVREQERFDAYYHNQFLIINDCLHRYKFAAKWMFFFDLDEFIYLTGDASFKNVMASLEGFSQILITQVPMSNKVCHIQDTVETTNKWGIEKMVYRSVKYEMNKKYAIQPRNVFATGVHLTMKLRGRTTHKTDHLMQYFHYHNTISQRGDEPCQIVVNDQSYNVDNTLYVQDNRMKDLANSVKSFELNTIGSILETTRQ